MVLLVCCDLFKSSWMLVSRWRGPILRRYTHVGTNRYSIVPAHRAKTYAYTSTTAPPPYRLLEVTVYSMVDGLVEDPRPSFVLIMNSL